MSVLVMLRANQVIQVHQHPTTTISPVILGLGPEIAQRNGILAELQTEGHARLET
jgi:hypothetical protein